MDIIIVGFVIILISITIVLIAIWRKNNKISTQPKMKDLLKGSYKEEIDNNE